ncbi:CRTAC1 family protein [Larkinella humicola]|uniref:CRTAC1 family protein n=1 Tax=Larkinella humicola TaxID=2607654 RepID=A0A5N1JDQ6_9BACT|nr:CRTAC1 family protein [Larkinella humicola]KAA9349196.1 CRTAC1 family protein [Larkinella humicola]
MKILLFRFIPLVLLTSLLFGCQSKPSSHEEMIGILHKLSLEYATAENSFCPEAVLAHTNTLLASPTMGEQQRLMYSYAKADAFLKLGEEEKAIDLLEEIVRRIDPRNIRGSQLAAADLAMAYLRLGEQTNCVGRHSVESCVLPLQGGGIHTIQTGSRKAIELYKAILEQYPDDLESRWLLNLAYMTLGTYPSQVPPRWLLPNMIDTTHRIRAFQDIAPGLKLNMSNMAGGVITEDFNNDGYLDLVTSAWGLTEPMQYFKNNGDGTFSDQSEPSGLKRITGGLNLTQTDYNNDGFTDIFVLRGAWMDKFGNQPNSLLKNNGDGTFTDVTTTSGLLSFHPTQTATWNDFNNDGWLDVFIGNETAGSMTSAVAVHPCELYLNNQDGTFTNVAEKAGCAITGFIKGVTSGDYDNDGRPDLFLSTLDGNRYLLKNQSMKGGVPHFEDVSDQAGLRKDTGNSFPTWFWDYNNDGWLDIFVCDYTFHKALSFYEAAEALNKPEGTKGTIYLYRNNQDGTFTNVAESAGLRKTAFSMGSNFGDIDNDGWLDMYLGSGSPSFKSLIPNKMFKSLGGEKFADVTASARVGNVQKGHGVSFADLDNDGDQDIYIEMGGAYVGDAYPNSFFVNPGQNANNWICLSLEGTQSNRAAIGSLVKVTFRENGVRRSVYREVNSGGSFGASPLRREIGIGKATVIDEIEIRWQRNGKKQVFRHIKPNQFLHLKEGSERMERTNLKKIEFKDENGLLCRTPLALLTTKTPGKP